MGDAHHVLEQGGAARGAEAKSRAGMSMNATLWTPTRESASTLAFMSTLRLHSSDWQWVDAPEQARWWVIDAGAHEDLPALATLYDRLPEKPQVAFLAAQLSQLPRPSWAFFKPPVKSGLVFNWIRPHEASRSGAATAGASHPWRQGRLRLRRWPNMSRYGNTLELTVACSRLLAAPASYEQMLQWQVPAPLLERLLADAHESGLLQFESGARAAAASSPAIQAPEVQPSTPPTGAAVTAAAAGGEHSRWDLVKRLLGKFARR
ncbi:MAG: hypothetical protein ABS84_07100 [Rubrivivax sp. SCN 71-131]|nr:MAG: hypothetical protein ABS84_07100 [Rubrivivax sp. SCN 71-131]